MFSNMVSCWQAAQYALGFQLGETVTHVGVGFRDIAVFESFLIL